MCGLLPPWHSVYTIAESENVARRHQGDDDVQHSRLVCEHNMICHEAFY